MKKILIALLLAGSCIVSAQDKKEIEELAWPANDPYAAINKIPEKWKNESAVVIVRNEYYSFSAPALVTIRKRVMLLDQAAVKQYSEFSVSERVKFRVQIFFGTHEKKVTDIIGIKVVKPDGTEKIVDVAKESVKTDDKVKIAVPNLEVGDIIDFYYNTTLEMDTKQEDILADEYPTMNLKIALKADNRYAVNLNSFNGAPAIKEINSKGETTYELTAADIEKASYSRWYYPMAEMPAYKFHVKLRESGNQAKFTRAFVPEKKGTINKVITKEDVLKYYDNKLWAFGNVGEVKKYIKEKGITTDEEKVIEAYYYCRHQYYTRYIEAILAEDAKIFNAAELYGYPIVLDTDKRFVQHFMAFLKENKIKYDVIVATPRENGPIKDMLTQPNIVLTIKVLTKEPIYLQFFESYNTPGTIDYRIEGTDAYALKVPNFAKGTAIENTTLPKSNYKDNTIVQKANITLNDDFTSLLVDRQSSVFGQFKADEQKDKLYFIDYADEDNKKYETKSLQEMIGNKKKREQYVSEFSAIKSKIVDKQKKDFEESTEAEYGFDIDDHTYKFTNLGRYDRLQPFEYSEKFTVKNELIKSAGQNYVIEIGKLIGQQLKLDDKENERKENIYSVFPRSYQEEINFEIPAGYSVSGIEKLNKKLENATGGFSSTAVVEGNVLKIKTYKYYVNHFEPNANWKDMVEFLNTAYQFTQEKILLKKS